MPNYCYLRWCRGRGRRLREEIMIFATFFYFIEALLPSASSVSLCLCYLSHSFTVIHSPPQTLHTGPGGNLSTNLRLISGLTMHDGNPYTKKHHPKVTPERSRMLWAQVFHMNFVSSVPISSASAIADLSLHRPQAAPSSWGSSLPPTTDNHSLPTTVN